jgi:4-carboxymuconolactone decarboxylase
MTRFPQAELPAELPIHNNLVRALYQNPDLFKSFGSLAMRVHSASHLTTRIRELAILRTAALLGADFEWGSHVPGALSAGITVDELRALRAGDMSVFDGQDAMAVRFAEAVDTRQVDDSLWEEVSAAFSPVELLDLTFAVGFYGFASRIVLALDIPLDEGLQGLDHP